MKCGDVDVSSIIKKKKKTESMRLKTVVMLSSWENILSITALLYGN